MSDRIQYDMEMLDYKPHLTYKPKILSQVDPKATYAMAPSLEYVTNMLPSGILQELTDLLSNINVLQKRLEQCLQDDLADGISFKEYKKEKKSAKPNNTLIQNYENYHNSNVGGKSQAEVYPLLLDIEDELKEFRDSLNNKFYDGKADYDNLDLSRKKDEVKIDDFVKDDICGSMSDSDVLKLQCDAHMLTYTTERINNTKEFVQDVNKVLRLGTNELYNGNIRSIVKELSKAPIQALNDLNEINLVKFNKSVVECNQDKTHGSTINSKEFKQGMNKVVDKITNMRVSKVSNIMSWVKTIDTDFDQSPLTHIVEDGLDCVEFVESEYNSSVLELFKHNKLDKMQKDDLITSMTNKKQMRQKHNLISDIIDERNSNTLSIDKFINDRKLDMPGTLCTS